jgi:polysaccharide lyase-like protein
VAPTARQAPPQARAGRFAACLAIALIVALPAIPPAGAGAASPSRPVAPRDSSAKKHRAKRHAGAGRRHHRRRRHAKPRRANVSRAVSISPNSAVGHKTRTTAVSSSPNPFDAGCDGTLLSWNTAGVGDAIPTTTSDIVRSGSGSCRLALDGSQERSELIFGGNGGDSTAGMVEFREGDEYWYGFSFYIVSMTYGRPGAHNLIMQFKGEGEGSPAFGLQLWDYEGDDGEYADHPRGLWCHGPSMGGDRFLALAPEQTWHDVAIHFKASGSGAGFYEVYLDGNLVDSRGGVSMIADGASYAYIKNGLYRNGGEIPGSSEIRLDAARLGTSLSAVSPS